MAINWPVNCVTFKDKAELMCIAKGRIIDEFNAESDPTEKSDWLKRLKVVDALIQVGLEKAGDKYGDMTPANSLAVAQWLEAKRSSTRWTLTTTKLKAIDYLADRGMVKNLQDA